MENKEMKKPIPVELNEEELDMVAGGDNTMQNSSTSQNGLIGPIVMEGEYCLNCGIKIGEGDVMFENSGPVDGYCEDCCKQICESD